MKRTTVVLLIAVAAALAVGGCTESRRARTAATLADRAADITCWSYGAEIYSGRSTGKVEYNDSGRVSFVDAANDRFTTLDGDCRVVYLNEDEEDAAPPSEAAEPQATDMAEDASGSLERPEKIPVQ